MSAGTDIERELEAALDLATNESPPALSRAMRHAVLPGGARVRPRLCRAVAAACGDGESDLARRAAVSIELLHCASLVHDDLPCFDDAPTRRGAPSVHSAFGEPIALLAGDALIVLAFEWLSRADGDPLRVLRATREIARGVGAPHGIVAGQAWESEPGPDLSTYHRAKAGALFAAAAASGAIAAGVEPDAWSIVGSRLGEAYQVADDMADARASDPHLGKPTRQDELHGRPNAIALLGASAAEARRAALLRDALDAIPPCPGRDSLRRWIADVAARFVAR
jgi:geranylgeranyl diphosphate synthase type II